MNTAFDLCVELLLLLAQLSGLTYKEINVWIFCIVWPLLTLGMATWIYKLVSENRRLKAGEPAA
jgi:hypothetical protein